MPLALGAAGMEPDIGWPKSDAAHVHEITLAERAIDGAGLVPDPPERRTLIVGRNRQVQGYGNPTTKRAGDGLHDVCAVTTGKAMDEDRSLPLSDREARCAIGMGRAPDHGIATLPAAAEPLDDGERFRSGLVIHGNAPFAKVRINSRDSAGTPNHRSNRRGPRS